MALLTSIVRKNAVDGKRCLLVKTLPLADWR